MNRLISNVLALALLGLLLGCRQTVPTYTVCLVDVSKSISPEGFRAEFHAVDALVDEMHRGDRLTIIPIAGNAPADTPGAVVMATAPTHRQAYDGDLQAFRAAAHRDIAHLREPFAAKPAAQTDILGTLDIVQDEFDNAGKEAGAPEFRRSLYVFSDFIEDDQMHHFAIRQKDSATQLAERLRHEHHLSWPDYATVQLFKIQSSDSHLIPPDTQQWIRVFWSAYFLPSDVHWTPLRITAADESAANRARR